MRIVCGLDVHKDSVFVCILNEKGEKFEAKYGVLTPELEELHQLLLTHEVKEVTMESTSIYWYPIWRILSDTPSHPIGLQPSLERHPHQQSRTRPNLFAFGQLAVVGGGCRSDAGFSILRTLGRRLRHRRDWHDVDDFLLALHRDAPPLALAQSHCHRANRRVLEL